MRLILGCVLTVVAVFVLVSAVVPRWRRWIFWKGTRIRAGATASLGCGLLLATGALALIAGEWLGEGWLAWVVPPLLVGGILVVVGRILDFRQPRRRSD